MHNFCCTIWYGMVTLILVSVILKLSEVLTDSHNFWQMYINVSFIKQRAICNLQTRIFLIYILLILHMG